MLEIAPVTMFRSIVKFTAMLMVAGTLSLPASAAAIHFVSSAGSSLILKGDSTLHKYECKTQRATAAGKLELSAKQPTITEMRTALFEGKMTQWIVRVPVKTLKSERDGLDENLQKALKADKYPDIVFTMSSYETYSAGADSRLSVTAKGTLTVAGKSRVVSIPAIINLADGSFILSGEKSLLMSDYGVVAPVLFMGTVKTDDKVVIHFKMHMVQSKK
jgi:polyisoprenoid-binding protein YceI